MYDSLGNTGWSSSMPIGLFHFPESHCSHCLKKAVSKGTPEKKVVYYHHVLGAKLVLDDSFVVSSRASS